MHELHWNERRHGAAGRIVHVDEASVDFLYRGGAQTAEVRGTGTYVVSACSDSMPVFIERVKKRKFLAGKDWLHGQRNGI